MAKRFDPIFQRQGVPCTSPRSVFELALSNVCYLAAQEGEGNSTMPRARCSGSHREKAGAPPYAGSARKRDEEVCREEVKPEAADHTD